ncbi:hypothetical protein ACFWIB_15300 [Streptomyces sp. NPDC127051]|uniref:hypothetical protein n=1 Tax=Streptomyces sp. NPDC127051 TaxID=3347119 RepID=UPI003657C410
MSDFAKRSILNGQVTLGPEIVNGTGHVYLAADKVRWLSNEEARALATALNDAADYASTRQAEMEASSS